MTAQPYPEHPDFKEPVPHQGAILPVPLPPLSSGGVVGPWGGYSVSTDLIGTIEVRLTSDNTEIFKFEKADWVPEVIRDFGVFVVGTGKIKNSRCGRFKPLLDDSAGACPQRPNEHKPFMLPIGCTRRECPDDFRRWANKDARRIVNSVNGYLRVKFKHQAELVPGFVPKHLPDHISIHPPRSLVIELLRRTKRDLQKALAKSKNDKYTPAEIFHRIFKKKYEYEEGKVLEKLGMKAAVSIYHPIRLKSDSEDWKSDQMQDTHRYRAVLDKETWIKHVKFSIHSHIITDGSFLMDYKEFIEESGGWTYRNHREISDVENLAKYLLSHAGAVPGTHSVRYLGDYQKMSIEGTMKVESFIPCPECLKEGTPASEATYVVGKIADTEYERDKNNRQQLVTWTWSEIYFRKYIKRVRNIPFYRMKELNPAGLPRNTLQQLNGKPLTYLRWTWENLQGFIVLPLPGCGPWSGISRKDVTRWISHYSPDEWYAFDKKPDWWV